MNKSIFFPYINIDKDGCNCKFNFNYENCNHANIKYGFNTTQFIEGDKCLLTQCLLR